MYEKCRRFRSGSGAACVTLRSLPFTSTLSGSPSATRFRDFSHRRRTVRVAIGFYLSKKGPSHHSDDDRTIIPYLHIGNDIILLLVSSYNTACAK